jgi:threonyl-tRNA synthetase
MIQVTFPDGAERAYEPGVSGLEIAKSISPSLAKRTVAMVRNGELADLADPIDRDATLEFLGRDDPRALELIRHDAALAGNAGHDWPGNRERLLLRLLPQPAVHA